MQTWILAVLALFFVQSILPNSIRYLQDKKRLGTHLKDALGGRDAPPEMPVIGARAARALANLQEALPVFVTLALLLQMKADVPSLAVQGAQVFLVFRILYVPAYLSGIPGIRTTMWMGSMSGMGMMLWSLLA